MRIPNENRDQLAVKFAVLFPHLDERQRRLLMGTEARVLRHDGVRAVAQAAAVSETTVRKRCSNSRRARGPWGGCVVRAGAANRSRIWIRGCGRHCWRW